VINRHLDEHSVQIEREKESLSSLHSRLSTSLRDLSLALIGQISQHLNYLIFLAFRHEPIAAISQPLPNTPHIYPFKTHK
jgi:hypothetical protein